MVSRHTATWILASNASSTGLLNITVVLSYSFPAPSDYPQNVEPTTISSTEILVSWDEVPAIDQNGIIILYEVQYEPLMTFGGQLMTMAVNTSNTSIVLGELQEYVEYNITVRAFTSVGPGPFSPGVNNRTFEDGKYIILYMKLYTPTSG